MSTPSYNELVACICGMAVQHCGLYKGSKFETYSCAANENAEAVLMQLGVLNSKSELIGDIPLSEKDVAERFKALGLPPDRLIPPGRVFLDVHERPVKPGWYWYHGKAREVVNDWETSEPMVVHVDENGNASMNGSDVTYHVKESDGLFVGPITAPRFPIPR